MVFIHRLKRWSANTTFAPNMENGTNCNFLEKQLRFFALIVTSKIFIYLVVVLEDNFALPVEKLHHHSFVGWLKSCLIVYWLPVCANIGSGSPSVGPVQWTRNRCLTQYAKNCTCGLIWALNNRSQTFPLLIEFPTSISLTDIQINSEWNCSR